jgi:hypothetical protein
VRYDAYLAKGEIKRRVEIDIDVQFKPTDEFGTAPASTS